MNALLLEDLQYDSGGTVKQDRLHDCERVFRESGKPLWRAVYAMSGRRDVADDAVAEAFMHALGSTNDIKDLRAWIYKVAFRAALRELKREREQSEAVSESSNSDPALVELIDALRLLPPQQRAAVALRYLEDAPVREIARSLGISQATVRVHLHRGRAKLRSALADSDIEGGTP